MYYHIPCESTDLICPYFVVLPYLKLIGVVFCLVGLEENLKFFEKQVSHPIA